MFSREMMLVPFVNTESCDCQSFPPALVPVKQVTGFKTRMGPSVYTDIQYFYSWLHFAFSPLFFFLSYYMHLCNEEEDKQSVHIF